MEFAIRHKTDRIQRQPSAHQCSVCHEAALVLQRRHISPERWGTPLVTEFYECDCCDTRYTYSPSDNRWRRLTH